MAKTATSTAASRRNSPTISAVVLRSVPWVGVRGSGMAERSSTAAHHAARPQFTWRPPPCNRPPHESGAKEKWSRRESNPRPLECDSSALPTELRPHRRDDRRGADPLHKSGESRKGSERQLEVES